MRSVKGLIATAAAAVIFLAGCGGGGVGPAAEEEEHEKDLLDSQRFGGAPVRVFIAAKRAFEEMGIQQTSTRPHEALSGTITTDTPGAAPILVNLTFEGKGKSTVVRAVIYNVRAGPTAKRRLKEKLFNTMGRRIKKFATLD